MEIAEPRFAVRKDSVPISPTLGQQPASQLEDQTPGGVVAASMLWLWYMVAAAVAAFLGHLCFIYATTNNPFAQDARRKRSPYIKDQKKRAEVIKQNFHVDKVPVTRVYVINSVIL